MTRLLRRIHIYFPDDPFKLSNSLGRELHTIAPLHVISKGGEGSIESSDCQLIIVPWPNLFSDVTWCVYSSNYESNLELIINGMICAVIPVSHHNLQPKVSFIGQFLKSVKTNPAFSFDESLIFI